MSNKILKLVRIVSIDKNSINIETMYGARAILPANKVIACPRNQTLDYTATIIIPEWLYKIKKLSPLRQKNYIYQYNSTKSRLS